ncbi:hypothetical protein RDABS01_030706, partial [Bienertia sinuspersici]
SELIDIERGEWDATRGCTFFKADVQALIFAISLLLLGQIGVLVYEVGSATSSRDNGDLWRTVWHLEGPPKLRHFVRNACKGNMAVKERLVHHHIIASSVCLVCATKQETIIHSLFESTLAWELWRHIELSSFLVNSASSSFAEH